MHRNIVLLYYQIYNYCWQKWSLNVSQSNCTVPSVSYHNLASPIRVKQNLLTFWSSGKLCCFHPVIGPAKMFFLHIPLVFLKTLVWNKTSLNVAGATIAACKFWTWLGGWFGWLGWLNWLGGRLGCSSSSGSGGRFGSSIWCSWFSSPTGKSWGWLGILSCSISKDERSGRWSPNCLWSICTASHSKL